MANTLKILSLSLILLLLNACNAADRLSRIGGKPSMDPINNYEPEVYPGDPGTAAQPTSYGGLTGDEPHVKTANSLWRPGSKAFFRDQRARSVGDILKVVVEISDAAKIENKSETSRNDSAKTGVPNVLGFEGKVGKIFPAGVSATNLIDLNSTDTNNSEGEIERKEKINTTIAASVIKILPSNNLVIRGFQQLRIDRELREILVEGVVRPEDISAKNSVTLDQIAEARVSYGGKGTISDYMQPRYGKQLLDVVSPF